jgi:hypothetical protein
VRKFQSAATYPGMVRLAERHARGLGHGRTGLRDPLTVDLNLSSEHERSRAFSRLREAAGDEQRVQAKFPCQER